ncbi:hypothetical protein FA13DRAFT_934160 [Coprinellus micaceus]|uniref:Uncharacterized protein n=1 Tax=Coprinellus micaceus TaxID=71717 RepID=A0A4Y7SZV7_COPMI|nr:hypothetical protein FA13DRAFT_934160 [Coprinellus micaceus]
MSFSAVAAMVRLGKKYDIPHLRDEGLARLKLQFPTRLEDFEKLSPTDYTHIKHTSGVSPSPSSSSPMSVIFAPSYLPYTLWSLGTW